MQTALPHHLERVIVSEVPIPRDIGHGEPPRHFEQKGLNHRLNLLQFRRQDHLRFVLVLAPTRTPGFAFTDRAW
jgi:hypothetical protein